MKLSYIYGKKVLSTAGKEGYVLGVYADGGKIVGLSCADGGEKEFFAEADGAKISNSKITYKKETKKTGTPIRLGIPVFDCEGAYLGKLTDFTVEKNCLKFAHVKNKKFSCGDIIVGDAVIIKSSARVLKSDVKKDNRVIIRRGTPLTPALLEKAQKKGEYVQTNLKTI